MSDDEFSLPGVSLEELEKIIQAFSQKGGPATNDEISRLVGSSKSTVSRNNKFLVSVGLIRGGQKKEATELGRKLGLALHHDQGKDVRKFWSEVVTGSEFLSQQVTAVRVQKAVPADDLPSKILYNSKSTKNKYNETGSRTVADILVKAGMLSDEDGTYTVQKGTASQEVIDEQTETGPAPPEAEKGGASSMPAEPAKLSSRPVPEGNQNVQLAVNLQIQIQEFDDTSKYEALFRALREHLLRPEPSDS